MKSLNDIIWNPEIEDLLKDKEKVDVGEKPSITISCGGGSTGCTNCFSMKGQC